MRYRLPIHYDAPTALASASASRFPRARLLGIATLYLDALCEHDFTCLPISENVRVTLNGVTTSIDTERPWAGPIRVAYRNTFVDPERGAIMFMGTVNTTSWLHADEWWHYGLRLRVVDEEITEVEEIVSSKNLRAGDPSVLAMPDRIWEQPVPEQERSTAAELEAIVDDYFNLVSRSIDPGAIAIGPDCQRLEVGVLTSNSTLVPHSVRNAFKDPSYKWNVVDRRVYVTDEVRGVVVAIGNFTTPPESPSNLGSVVLEAFKVQEGVLKHIEAVMNVAGQSRSGWSPEDVTR